MNERHYGALQGLNKAETAKIHGEEQVLIWRRSYATPPPVLEADDERAPANDPKYANVPKEKLPLSESLSDTVDRFMPLWNETLAPAIKNENKKVCCGRYYHDIARPYADVVAVRSSSL